jgi:HlyD family secretion protein
MKKIIIIVLLVVIVAVFILANVLKKEKGIEVDVEKVQTGTITQKVTGSGQIRPEVQVKVSSTVAGKILKLHAEEGDTVKKGRLLVELDQEQYIAALERAESNLLSMLASQKKMKNDMDRSKDLYAKGLMSEAEFQAVEASYEAAISNTSQAQAAVREAKDRLSKTRLYSDMDGIVSRLNKEEGEMTLGSQFQEDVIMIVADLSKMEAAIEVDENDVINISLGDSSAIEIDAFGDTTFKGIVTEIANSATVTGLGTQEQVTNFQVVVALKDFNKRFRPGMSTTVDIITETRNEVLKVPIQAVTVREKETLEKKPDVEDKAVQKEAVTTGSDDKASKDKKTLKEVVFCVEDGKAVARPVELGISDDTHYEIKSGVQAGETVITGPFRLLSKTLKAGDLLMVKEESKKEKAETETNTHTPENE